MSSYAAFPWSTVDAMEDPVVGLVLTRAMFFETYGALLETLDGEDREFTVEYFFVHSPVNCTLLRFRDDRVKSEWIEYAIELKCIPSLVETSQGEDLVDQQKRQGKPIPQQQHQHQQKQPKRQTADPVQSIVAGINKLNAQIEADTALGKDTKVLEEKLARAQKRLDATA